MAGPVGPREPQVNTGGEEGRRPPAGRGRGGAASTSVEGGQHEIVLDRVGRGIVAGLYEPGTPLDPAALERDLDVSRPVVREALRVLDTLGMVRAWPKRGTFVRPRSDWNWLHPLVLSWSQDQHRDVEFLQAVAQMREIVEPHVAAIAASHRTEAEALELGAALGAMESADWDIERFIDADVRFHHVLLWATHNELLAQMASVIESAIRNHDRGVSAQHWVESLVLHREVADAVARRSPEDAEAAMRQVLAQALSDIVGADGVAAGRSAPVKRAPSSRSTTRATGRRARA